MPKPTPEYLRREAARKKREREWAEQEAAKEQFYAAEEKSEQEKLQHSFRIETFPLPPWGNRAVFWVPRWTVPVGAIVLIGAIVFARRG